MQATDMKDFSSLTENELPPVLKSWASAIEAGCVDAIAAHYAPTARLKGTVWSRFVTHTPDHKKDKAKTIINYFVFLLNGREQVTVRWNNVLEVAPDVFAVDYTFCWTNEETGEAEELLADATFVLGGMLNAETGSSKKIVLHHSSPAQ